MKTYLISDNVDTYVGLKISGILGEVAHTKEEVLGILERLRKDKEIGIIIITEKIGDLIPEEVTKIKLEKTFPLLVEIPDRHGSTRGEDHIMRLVKESIGLKI
ncbi:MAG: V-type ATP synthase subunit F [Bacillota bacterium]|nr:V-type ATP synthase subunit F [Bacillota bacterium]